MCFIAPRRKPLQRADEQLLVGGIVQPATDAGGVRQWHEQRAVPLERLADDILQPLRSQKCGDGHAADRQNDLWPHQLQLAQQVGAAER